MLLADLFHSDTGLKMLPDDSRTFWLAFVWFKSTADLYHRGLNTCFLFASICSLGAFFGLLSLFLPCDMIFVGERSLTCFLPSLICDFVGSLCMFLSTRKS